MLPTFVIIGAMKAGTTSLWSYLGRHPDVFVAPDKELNFFVAERNWPKGVAWYDGKFREAKAAGEASPTYTMAHAFADVPARMASVIPDARLIYLVRHPVERMRSHYLHTVAAGTEKRPIEQAFLEGLDYIQTSCYAFQLERYLEHFPRERILILTSEELRDARLATVRRAFSFLGVDPDVVPMGLDSEEHRTEDKRAQSAAARMIEERPAARRLVALAPAPVRRLLSRATTRPLDTSEATVPPALVRRIVDGLRPDLERLSALAGPGFSAWGLL